MIVIDSDQATATSWRTALVYWILDKYNSFEFTIYCAIHFIDQFWYYHGKKIEKKKKTAKREEDDIELHYGSSDKETAVKSKVSQASPISRELDLSPF